jgi:hypothetical protein
MYVKNKISNQLKINQPLRKCFKLRTLGLYYSGCQSQQSFLLLSLSTHSLHVSARAGHLQMNIFFEASYCLLMDLLFGLSLYI